MKGQLLLVLHPSALLLRVLLTLLLARPAISPTVALPGEPATLP